eukprot:TRINITY_DN32111_c0_g1_i1.p1 TRINITY_DN32111_c0_g1~~TRINITY_DN32111_c0_g1_i1.p1  ORF type:complete len:195 (+),score=39.69 TRINITY_DN32111_c0_g1_i1:520-1104(+)
MDIKRRIQDQQQQVEDYDTVTPTSYPQQEQLWPGYSKVLADLLKDRRHSQTSVKSPSSTDTNKYVWDPVVISTNTIVVSPNIIPLKDNPRNPSDKQPTTQVEQYDPPRPQYRISDTPGRNWTSIEVAKPVWDEEPGRVRKGGWSLEQRNIHNVDSLGDTVTYGQWDHTLDIMPAMSRTRQSTTTQLGKNMEDMD